MTSSGSWPYAGPTTTPAPFTTMMRPSTLGHNSLDPSNVVYNLTTALSAALSLPAAEDPEPGGGSGGGVGGDALAGITVGAGPGELLDNVTNATSLQHPQYYDPLYQAVAVTLSSIIFAVGIVGNVLVVIVIGRTRSMHTTTNCYLLSLAVADCLVLLAATLPAVPETFFRIDEWPFGRALCSLLIYAQYVGIDASSLSITAFTIERYIAICHPIRAQTMCTVSRAKKIIAGLWTFTVLYCGPWLGLTDLNVFRLSDGSTITKCLLRLARPKYLVLYVFDLVVFYLLPFLIATILYCLIGRILVLSSLRHARDRPTRTPLGVNGGGATAGGGAGSVGSGARSSDKKPRQQNGGKRRSDSRVQVIRMLVVVVLVFATLWMPYRVIVFYNSFAKHKFMDLWFLMFARTLVYINCAINPILYNVMSVKFRRAFKNLLCCVSCHYDDKVLQQRSSRSAPKRASGTSSDREGLRPVGTPVFLYSEVNTEGTNVKRHTFSASRPPKRDSGQLGGPSPVSKPDSKTSSSGLTLISSDVTVSTSTSLVILLCRPE